MLGNKLINEQTNVGFSSINIQHLFCEKTIFSFNIP